MLRHYWSVGTLASTTVSLEFFDDLGAIASWSNNRPWIKVYSWQWRNWRSVKFNFRNLRNLQLIPRCWMFERSFFTSIGEKKKVSPDVTRLRGKWTQEQVTNPWISSGTNKDLGNLRTDSAIRDALVILPPIIPKRSQPIEAIGFCPRSSFYYCTPSYNKDCTLRAASFFSADSGKRKPKSCRSLCVSMSHTSFTVALFLCSPQVRWWRS